jgi:hypothetical protein
MDKKAIRTDLEHSAEVTRFVIISNTYDCVAVDKVSLAGRLPVGCWPVTRLAWVAFTYRAVDAMQ